MPSSCAVAYAAAVCRTSSLYRLLLACSAPACSAPPPLASTMKPLAMRTCRPAMDSAWRPLRPGQGGGEMGRRAGWGAFPNQAQGLHHCAPADQVGLPVQQRHNLLAQPAVHRLGMTLGD